MGRFAPGAGNPGTTQGIDAYADQLVDLRGGNCRGGDQRDKYFQRTNVKRAEIVIRSTWQMLSPLITRER